ncbi:unnamed protein product [Lymnaea stagnalis]|uniref:Uncharacterized protein n=1 Tax=Lymnaea stagnalis TaxID=6523 RepID=A0AAV2I3E3_LYMST
MYLLRCILTAIGIFHLVSGTAGQTTACGGILTSQAGTIMSPNFPSNYPDNVTCTWVITVAQNQVIAVRFHRFDVDPSDRVTFYDGNTTSRPVLKGYLGGYWDDSKMSTFRIRTTGPSLLIVFNAWGPPSGLGFSASYWAHECPPFTYGLDYCNSSCSCQESNTHVCNSTSGQCECKSGWQSTRCDVIVDVCGAGHQCSDPYESCASRSGVAQCSCRQGLVYNDSTKRCESTCTTQQSSCSHACGVVSTNPHKEQCYCPHGMKLDPANNRTCVECTGWFYGEDCKSLSTCNRQHTKDINKINGSCICYSNWTYSECQSDFDECNLNPSNYCNLTKSKCSNVQGDFACPCLAGYEEINTKMCRECGKIFTNPNGTISSHFYSHDKTNVEVCSWTIAVQAGSVIDLSFTSFGLHNGIHQTPDTVKIFDGADASAQLLGSFDGLTYHDGLLPPGYVRSSGNTMHIVRYSGQSSSYGFSASYTSHECKEYFHGPTCSTSCNCNKTNTQYCNSVTGQCICKQEWTSYDCSADKDECLVTPRVCPNYSDCKNLQPRYDCPCKAGLVQNDQGQCVYSSESTSSCSRSCGGMCVHMKATGVEHCYCPIGLRLVGDSCVNCSDGTFGPNCTLSCPCARNSTASCDAVTGQCACKPGWTSDSCSQDIDECYSERFSCPVNSDCLNRPGDYECVCQRGQGLENADRKTCKQRECNFILTSPSGTIASPDYPNNYYNNANCTWAITAEQGKVISVRVDTLATELNYDFLTFYNGNNLNGQIIGRYHGDSIPRIIRSVGNTMFISFTSDGSNVGIGFKANYYSHTCSDFMFGDTCTEQCRCNKTNTEYCGNIQGECLCKLGWKGYTCIDDVRGCLGVNNFLCPRDSDCRNTAGNYECVCHPGFLKNNSTNLCDRK